VKLNPGLSWQKNIRQEEGALYQQTELKLTKELLKCYIWSTVLYGAETWTIREADQKHLEILKCGAREGWKRSVGPIV
jgi:hypothetical protein